MALSEQEQKMLAQMEAALAAEDPKLVNSFRGTTARRVHRRRATFAGIGFFVGLTLLLAGLATYAWLSVVGFVLMVIAAVAAIYAWQHVGNAPIESPDAKHTPSSAKAGGYQSSQSFMDKMEERWRRRRDEDF
ncbi:MAG: DUF3040 domain-containing protein [Propionibacteriaceae bacterium]